MSQTETAIRNCREEFPRVVDAVDRFAAEHRLSQGVVGDMQVALDEILTNIVDYGYTDHADHEIRIRLRVIDNVLEAAIEDDGFPFNPLESHAPDVSAQLSERRAGGLGIHFVKNLMTEIIYDRVGNRNLLVLRKNLTT
ncbi:MAG: ATP-binding protein [Betaproteobacteria bacterium]|nr:ATP-binding protein [Betaproteobacteria bacterium]